MKLGTPRNGLLLAALLGLGVLAWFGWRWYSTPAPPQIPLEGMQEEVAQAVGAALEDVRRQPRSGAAWGKLAMVLHANGLDEHLVECYLRAESLDPKNPRWPYLHGLRLLEGDREQGTRLFREALARATRPEDRAPVLFRLAQVLIEDQQLDEAERHLLALREIERESGRVHFGLGLLAVAREDRAAARRHLGALTEVPFARRRALALLAGLEEDQQAARKHLELAARLPRDEPWPDPFEAEGLRHKVDRMGRIARFWALKKQGRQEEAISFLRGYVARSPDPEVCFLLGCHLFARNDPDGAEPMFRATLREEPSNVKAQLFLGEVLCQKADKLRGDAGARDQALDLFREALAAEDRALAAEPTLGLAHLSRGRALKGLGRTDEAVRAFREAVRCQPHLADVHLALGEALAESGQLDEGLEHLGDAVQLAPPADPRPRQALEKWQERARAPEKK